MVVLSEVAVDIVAAQDEARFRDLMQAHHDLGAVPGMGETVRYVTHHRGRWQALVVFSAPALKCGARDRWIGWSRGVQFGRLHLVTTTARVLILPGGERNLGSRVLSLLRAPSGERLAGALRSRHAPGGDLRRDPALHRRRLPCIRLDTDRDHPEARALRPGQALRKTQEGCLAEAPPTRLAAHPQSVKFSLRSVKERTEDTSRSPSPRPVRAIGGL